MGALFFVEMSFTESSVLLPPTPEAREQESIVQQLNILPVADLATWTLYKGRRGEGQLEYMIKYCTGGICQYEIALLIKIILHKKVMYEYGGSKF